MSFELTDHLGNVRAVVQNAAGSFTPPPAVGVNVTWNGAGADNNWSTAANWAGGVVPGVNDKVIFNATSVKNCSINTAVNVAGMLIEAGYTGTITQQNDWALTVRQLNFVQLGGTFIGGGTGASFTLTGEMKQLAGTFNVLNTIFKAIPAVIQPHRANITYLADYYPFGSEMPGRKYVAGSYRYGFNGMEKDQETGTYTTEYRQYNPRIGRWMSMDPLVKTWASPYSFVGDNPVSFNDPLGLAEKDKKCPGCGSLPDFGGGRSSAKVQFLPEMIASPKKSNGLPWGIIKWKTEHTQYSPNVERAMSIGKIKVAFFRKEEGLTSLWDIVGGITYTTFAITKLPVLIPAKTVSLEANIAAKGVSSVASKTLPELQIIAKQNSAAFRQLFGTGKEGAQSVLNNIKNTKVPEGLSKEAMQAYRELINRVPDPAGTQAIRAKILDHLLK